MSTPIPFNALRPGEDTTAVKAAIDRVIASGWFVLASVQQMEPISWNRGLDTILAWPFSLINRSWSRAKARNHA